MGVVKFAGIEGGGEEEGREEERGGADSSDVKSSLLSNFSNFCAGLIFLCSCSNGDVSGDVSVFSSSPSAFGCLS